MRFVSRDALGIINVRLLLFSDTVLFISREAVRKACLGRDAKADWSGEKFIWPISQRILNSGHTKSVRELLFNKAYKFSKSNLIL